MAADRRIRVGGRPGSAASANAGNGSKLENVRAAARLRPPRAGPRAPLAGPGARSATRRSTKKGGMPGFVLGAVTLRLSAAPPLACPATPWQPAAKGSNGGTPRPGKGTGGEGRSRPAPIADCQVTAHRGARAAQSDRMSDPPTSAGCRPGNRNTPWWTWTPGKSTVPSTAGPTPMPAQHSSSCPRGASRSSPRTIRWRGRWGGGDSRDSRRLAPQPAGGPSAVRTAGPGSAWHVRERRAAVPCFADGRLPARRRLFPAG